MRTHNTSLFDGKNSFISIISASKWILYFYNIFNSKPTEIKNNRDIDNEIESGFNPDHGFYAMEVTDVPTKKLSDPDLTYGSSSPSDYEFVEHLINCAYQDSNDNCK